MFLYILYLFTTLYDTDILLFMFLQRSKWSSHCCWCYVLTSNICHSTVILRLEKQTDKTWCYVTTSYFAVLLLCAWCMHLSSSKVIVVPCYEGLGLATPPYCSLVPSGVRGFLSASCAAMLQWKTHCLTFSRRGQIHGSIWRSDQNLVNRNQTAWFF